MSISLNTVKKVSKLARIQLPEKKEPQEKLQKELSSILDWVQQLQSVNVQDVEALVNPSQLFEKKTPMREDQVTDGAIVEDILANAPEKAHNMFVVPKVVE